MMHWESETSGRIGSIASACPCSPVGYSGDYLETCGISRTVCDPSLLPELPELQDACEATDSDSDVLEYAANLAPRVRKALRDRKTRTESA
jgi:hypothetical protein